MQYVDYCTNKNWFLENITDVLKTNNIWDIFEQCRLLGKNFNPQWSNKRFQEEHNNMTQEIMKIELRYLENTKWEYRDDLNFDGIEMYKPQIITCLHDLYMLGNNQHHCIYSNYRNYIMQKSYFAIRIIHDDNVYTIGIRAERDELSYIDQIKGKYNQEPPEVLKRTVQRWFDANPNWFEENSCYKKKVEQLSYAS